MAVDPSAPNWDSGPTPVLEETRPEVRKPKMYQVVLLNDDFTPMEFVVELIEKFFNKSRDVATRIMLLVHTEGRGVCGVYTQDIAETKASVVSKYARQFEHPLLCQAEPCSDE
ncbi:MAG: ATP-dependent Clp protease adapter ClpS [Cellvibrionales bacterium TMED49]|nr:MAG: ATP-dependent Clp protease adapter ClpS [Cellvibrionales bacterium TMED49]|tara:strand:+ start:156 stop:494 length:339 start_codon:yes stop_codon:yes gene_type:complete